MNKQLLGSARNYLDLIKGLVLVLNSNGKIEYVNQWLCIMLGYSKKEMLGKNWFEHFIPKEIKTTRIKEFEKLINEGSNPFKLREIYLQTKEGELLLVQWKDSLLKDNEGNLLGVLSSGEDITEKFILRKHLMEQRTQNRKELMQAVLEAAELERKQIAYELHDGVNQVLTVCKLLLENEMTVHHTTGMKKVTMQIQNVIDEIRILSHRLNPADLGNEGLYAVVKELIQEMNITRNLFIRLKTGGTRFLKSLPSSTALNLFRIIQEALSNILKHAKATEVKIELYGSKKAVDLEIWDDGKGFKRKAVSEGLGLKTIYTRAEAIGGQAYISSAPGEGTLLSVHVPLAS